MESNKPATASYATGATTLAYSENNGASEKFLENPQKALQIENEALK